MVCSLLCPPVYEEEQPVRENIELVVVHSSIHLCMPSSNPVEADLHSHLILIHTAHILLRKRFFSACGSPAGKRRGKETHAELQLLGLASFNGNNKIMSLHETGAQSTVLKAVSLVSQAWSTETQVPGKLYSKSTTVNGKGMRGAADEGIPVAVADAVVAVIKTD